MEENNEDEYIKLPINKTVDKLIDIIMNFGDGETEFHTRDIEQLINGYLNKESEPKEELIPLSEAFDKVTRLEVIDSKQGRQLVKYLNKGESFEFSFQDDNRTLKI